MSEKSKPRFNIIDAIVLAVLISAAVFGVYKTAEVIPGIGGNVSVSVTVRVRNVGSDVAEAFVKELPSACVSGTSVVSGSTVKSAVIEPAYVMLTTLNGDIVSGVDPTRVDLLVTVEAVCPKNGAFYKVGNQEARIGSTFYVKTRDVELPGTVTDIRTADET